MTEAIEPGSAEELRRFEALQARLPSLFRDVLADPRTARTVVIVPGLSLDPAQLARICGTLHYEERHLSMLFLLRMPRTRLVLVTSEPLQQPVVDYYIHMLHGVPAADARRRLLLLSACDDSPVSLTQKILERPQLLQSLREATGDPEVAHLSVFNSSPLERSLAVRLGIPLYACDPALATLGGKSGSRRMFREAGIPLPEGSEDLRDADDVAAALAQLKRRQPSLRRAAVKLDEGFSGEGNALFDFRGAPQGNALAGWIAAHLPQSLRFEAPDETWEGYCAKLARDGGIVEAWIEGEDKHSPSAQFRIDPLGRVEPVSTHDQVLGGATGQVFQGSTFPARAEYRGIISDYGHRVAQRLASRGVIGRFAVDFVVARTPDGWQAEAIEINLRKGGTTFPLQVLQLMTGGHHDAADGEFRTPAGRTLGYYATDNLVKDAYRRLTPTDVIGLAGNRGLQFDPATGRGVAFSMLGCVADHGKLGVTAIGHSPAEGLDVYDEAVRALDQAAAG